MSDHPGTRSLGRLVGLALLGLSGLIVRLCEKSWGKRKGGLGSTALLTAAGILCLPAFLLGLAVLLDSGGLVR